MAYDIGDRVRLSATFSLNAVNTDPTTVIVKVRTPRGLETKYTYITDSAVVKDAVGKYHVDVDITESGYWYQRWQGTGAVVAAEEQSFQVNVSKFK